MTEMFIEQLLQKNGRPSKFGEESLGRMTEYLLNHLNEVSREEIPSVPGCALFIGVVEKTMHNWRTRIEDLESDERTDEEARYLQLYETLLTMQHMKLLNGGLRNDYNAAITKMLLTKHSYRDSSEVVHMDSEGNPVKSVPDVFVVTGVPGNFNEDSEESENE